MGIYDFNTSNFNIDRIVATLRDELRDIVVNSHASIEEIKARIAEDEILLNRLKDAINSLPDYTAQYNVLATELDKIKLALQNLIDHPINLETIPVSDLYTEVQKINGQYIYANHALSAIGDISGRNIVDTYATKDELASATSGSLDTLSAISAQLNTAITAETERAEWAEAQIVDTLNGETDRAIQQENIIEQMVIDETSRAIENENAIQETLNQEIADRTSEISSLQNQLNDEIAGRTEAVSDLQGSLNTEISNRVTADTALDTKISDEIERATDEENQIKQTLEAVSGGLADDLTDLQTALNNEITTRGATDTQLQENIETEASTRASAMEELQGALNREETARGEAIDTLQGNLETSAANLQSNIDTEETARIAGDTALSESLTAEETARTAADTTLQSNIDAEASARTTADTNLQSQIDTIEATQNVIDLVGTYDELQNYDTTNVKVHDKIQVINDSTHENQSTIYSWENDAWSYIGMFGPYYTVSQIDATVTAINSSIADEVTRAEGAEANIASDLSNEITRATAAEQALADSKQNNLSAGDGIDITNDVVSHSVKVIENDDEEDTVEGTVFTVYLKNNRYKVITLDPEITEIHFMIEESPQNVLQETGFEFTVPEDSELETLTFNVIDNVNKKIYTIIPDSYMSPNIYQGTIVNYRCTIGEYEVED